ncbi:MAG: hypothetical protein ACFCBW_10000 [Candidatus Competibacterales bacterium]
MNRRTLTGALALGVVALSLTPLLPRAARAKAPRPERGEGGGGRGRRGEGKSKGEGRGRRSGRKGDRDRNRGGEGGFDALRRRRPPLRERFATPLDSDLPPNRRDPRERPTAVAPFRDQPPPLLDPFRPFDPGDSG